MTSGFLHPEYLGGCFIEQDDGDSEGEVVVNLYSDHWVNNKRN